jgi:hypothetical protein
MSNLEAPRNTGSSFGLVRLLLLVVELFLGAMVLILGAAFVMSLLGANPEAGFASWIYSRTDAIMQPFNGIFSPITITDSAQVNTSLLFAMAVYAVLAAVIEGISRRL